MRRGLMRAALIGGTIGVIAAVATSVVAAYQYRSSSQRHQDEVGLRTFTLVRTERLIIASERTSRRLRTFLLSGENHHLAERNLALESFNEELQALRDGHPDETGQKLLAEISRHSEEIRTITERLVADRQNGAEFARVVEALKTELQPPRDALDEALRLLGEHDERALDEAVARAHRFAEQAFSALAAAISASILLATLFGVFLAVTLRRLARNNLELERALAASEAARRDSRALAESMPQIVWTARPDGGLDYINEVLARYIGKSVDHALGTSWTALIHPEDLPAALHAWNHSVRTATPFTIEYRIRRQDGAYRWFLVRASPLLDEHGAVLKWFGTSTDVEDLKHAEQAAMSGVRLRDDFLTVASHELRTPLTSLKLQLDLMEKELRDGGKADMQTLDARLQQVRRQAARLRLLNESILEASALDRGELDLRPELQRLDRAVDEVVQKYRADLLRSGCSLDVDLQPVEAVFDSRRLDDVLRNLLTNAAKYGLGRPVTITVREEGDYATVSVKDAGIGMDEAARARIFAKFERASPSTSYGGLGLGLYISRRLVEAMRGRLAVVSSPGAGSTFSVSLPRQRPEVDAPSAVMH